MNALRSYISESLLDMGNVDNADALIEEFLKENYKITGSYTITDGIVDVKGSIVAISKDITSLTNGMFRFGEIKNNFYCINCPSLTSLEGAPRKVGRDFDCSRCKKLKSLEGAPEVVERHFYCINCDSLTSLEGAPQKVYNGFFCNYCQSLTSLKGAPKKTGGEFSCSNCDSLVSLIGAPEEVGGSFDCRNCGKKFIREEVTNICKVKKGIHL